MQQIRKRTMKSGILTGLLLTFCMSAFFPALSGCERKETESPSAIPPAEEPSPAPAEKVQNRDNPFTVGVLYWSMNIPGQVAMRVGLEAAAKTINREAEASGTAGIKLIPHVAGDGEEGIERQISQMNELIDQNVDLIIVQPTDIAALSKPLLRANEADIPVVSYDQYIIGGELACYLTSDNYQAGYLGGEYVAANFPDEQTLRVVLIEYPHVSATVKRVDGFIDALEDYQQPYTVLKTYIAVEPVAGAKVGSEILAEFPESGSIDVIFSNNDGAGLSIVETLEAAGRSEIFFASVDGDPTSVENIRDGGIMRIDTAQFCGELGAESMRASYRLLRGEDVGDQILIPVFPITRETIEMYKGWTSPVPKPFDKPWHSSSPHWTGEKTVIHAKESHTS